MTGFFLGMHARDLTWPQALWLALMVTLAKMLVDGVLWSLVKCLWHLTVWFVQGLINDYRRWRMFRTLNGYRSKMVKQRAKLHASIEQLEMQRLKLLQMTKTDKTLKLYNRMGEMAVKLKGMDASWGLRADQMNDQINTYFGNGPNEKV